MPRSTIPTNATLTVIKGRLRDRIEYVRRVLANMQECEKKYEKSVVVRIGVTGEGNIPHYRIEPEEGADASFTRQLLSSSDDEHDTEAAYYREAFFKAYNGSNHKHQQDWGQRELKENSWSKHAMTTGQVRTLLGNWRDYKPRPKQNAHEC